MQRRPKLTGPDYLLAAATRAAERGQPYAQEFQWMVTDALTGEEMLLAEVTAERALREHEASPVAIVLAAYQLALENGDRKSVDETLQVGLSLLAKWPDYLLARTDRHPDFERRETGK